MNTSEAESALRLTRTRPQAAAVYARLLRERFGINWAAVNRVILERWSMNGLKTIKALAWKLAQAEGPIEDKGVHLN